MATNPASLTFTERIGLTTAWGRYLTEIEQQAMDAALALFPKPADALEVGCQGGRWSEMLVRKGWRVTCTDVDPEALRACQERIPTAKCILVNPGDRTIPCADASADLLLCIEVNPVIHSDWFPGEANRVLRPGGVLFGVFLNSNSPRGMFVLLREKLPLRKPKGDGAYALSYGSWKKRMQRLTFDFPFERGFCWFPFSRKSNSPLVPACTAVERALGLQRLPGLSPWVAFIARKSGL
jgi:SAM-dependent methyltransferase